MTYPEHDKLKAVENESRVLSEFFEWLDSEGLFLASPDKTTKALPSCGHLPISERPEVLLARYFSIDLRVLESEKRQMLTVCRDIQNGT